MGCKNILNIFIRCVRAGPNLPIKIYWWKNPPKKRAS
jgi:hypothetical protein